MQKIIFKCFSFLLSVILMTSPVMADESKITKEHEFTSEDKNQKAEDRFDSEITENKQKYKLADISYETINEEPVTTVTEVTTIIETEPIKNEDEYKPEETIIKDGVTYTLSSKTEKEVIIEEGWEQKLTGYNEYDSMEEAKNAPKTKKLTAKNGITGNKVSKNCDFTGITEIPAKDWEDTYIDITFISYDAEEFVWNGITVPKNEKEPLKGYEDVLLQSVGGDSENYKVIEINWQGKAYRNSSGVLCRNARADVRKRVSRYRVNYEGTVIKESVKGKVYTLTYTGEKETVSDKTIYTIKAVATYEPVEAVPVLQITLLIIILIVFFTGVLFILKKKNKYR